MLVSFNPYITNTKAQKQSPNFKSLQNGIIEAAEVAKYTSNATECRKYIYLGAYKPTIENLNALLRAKEIATKNTDQKISLPMALDEAIEMLRRKAKEAGINL